MFNSPRFRLLIGGFLVLLSFTVAIFSSFWTSIETPNVVEDTQLTELSSTVNAIEQPHPSLSPLDVVRLQLSGLSSDREAEGILQCMTFASPGNRLVTGPLQRFGQMVRSANFKALSNPDRVLIGDPTYIGKNARILVTLVGAKKLSSYVWVLSKQEESPYRGCWMTDGVFPLHIGGPKPGAKLDVI